MATSLTAGNIRGVWSATPTPLTENDTIDKVAVKRLVEHHIRLGVKGLFLCGTCGEGPWLTDALRQTMVREVVKANAGRMLISVQVTDNSEMRMLSTIKWAATYGADIAVIAPPHMVPPETYPGRLRDLYLNTIKDSELPIGIYDRGQCPPNVIPFEVLAECYEQKRVVMVKDSSADLERMKKVAAIRQKRKGLYLMNGWEFNCVPYLKAGYDGLMLGGAIFNGYIAQLIIKAVKKGDIKGAEALQERMNRMMYDVYGGKEIGCWLTGLKELLVRMGIFRTNRGILGHPLTESCSNAIDAMLENDRDVLLP